MLLTALIGLLIGLAVNFRLPNLFLSSGYLHILLWSHSCCPGKSKPSCRASYSESAFLIGMAPTLLANAINAGSPFSTTYGGADVAPPELNVGVIWAYVADMQFVLLVLAGAWTALMLRLHRERHKADRSCHRPEILLVNLVFFMSHPVFTPYYTIPVAMLSLWSLLFASLMQPAEAVDDGLVRADSQSLIMIWKVELADLVGRAFHG